MTSDLRLGNWCDVLADVECDTLISDPPYSKRTHEGNERLADTLRDPSKAKMAIPYYHWTEDDVRTFVGHWSDRVAGWFCVMTSHDLYPAYRTALEAKGRYVFAPIPCVVRGMSLRLCGDGPSSWTCWLVVSRPRSRMYSSWGTLCGAYIVGRGDTPNSRQMIGGKTLHMMKAIIRDYSRPGDLVCDPCAGMATTGVAAASLGRRFVGAEIDPDTHARAVKRLALPSQAEMFV